jgi:hypothetical protein
MAMIIRGKSICPLCNEVLEEGEHLTAFPAFLPSDHLFGKFSDAAFHTICFEKDPDADAVHDVFYIWKKIWDSRPKELKTIEEMEAWNKEAFKDFPPKGRVVIFEQLFCSDDGCEADWWYMDADDYQAMCDAEDKAYKEMEERRAEADRRERDAWRYARDD